LRHVIDGWSVWPVLRFSVASVLAALPLAMSQALETAVQLRLACGDAMRFFSLPRSRHLAIAHCSSRTERQDGRSKDVFFDDLLRDIGSYCKVENVDNQAFLADWHRSFLPAHATTSLISLAARLFGRARPPAGVQEVAEALRRDLATGFGESPLTERHVRGALCHFYWSKRLWSVVLGRVRPRFVFVVTAYNEHAVIAAARELGATVIEFQHGLIDAHHVGYAWRRYATAYKSRMPLPNQIFLYGEHWRRELETDGFWKEELRAVGSLRLDSYRALGRAVDPDACTGVLTTQGLDTERLLAFVAQFLDLAQSKAPIRLYVKLHPGELSTAPYEAVLGRFDCVTILLGRTAPSTFDLLRRARFHLSISSSCHYEALGLGVPTVILPFATHDRLLPLVHAGHAFLARSPSALADLVSSSLGPPPSKSVSNLYFVPGALENMKRELVA
jgi:hypothetical protein